MDNIHSFPLSIDYRGEHFEGSISPSEEHAANGKPVYYRVMIGDTLFAYLCCGDTGWRVREENGQHAGLVAEIGNYINRYYEYSEIE